MSASEEGVRKFSELLVGWTALEHEETAIARSYDEQREIRAVGRPSDVMLVDTHSGAELRDQAGNEVARGACAGTAVALVEQDADRGGVITVEDMFSIDDSREICKKPGGPKTSGQGIVDPLIGLHKGSPTAEN